MARSPVRSLTLAAMFTVLVNVATMAFHVPVPATQGIINLGDSMIFLAGLLAGPSMGAVAGGFGSALANLQLGLTHWAPWTLVIKGLEGFIVGAIGHRAFRSSGKISPTVVVAVATAGLWMIAGYFVAGSIMFGYRAALVELPGNFVQAGGSAVIGLPLARILHRVKFLAP